MLGPHTGGLVGIASNAVLTHPNGFQGWLLHCLCCIIIIFLIVSHVLLLFSPLYHNPMLGTHTGGLLGSSQPSIVAKASRLEPSSTHAKSGSFYTILPIVKYESKSMLICMQKSIRT